jgi:hypothetical protein
MEQARFFYSTDGSDAHGPVTEDELRVLVRDRTVGMSSFLYRDGETTWRPFDPDAFQPPIPVPRLPRYEPPPYVPTIHAKARAEALAEELVAKKDEGPFPTLFLGGCLAVSAGAIAVLTYLQGQFFGYATSFTAALLFVGFLPFGLSRLFPRAWKLRVWAVGLVVLATFTILGQLHMSRVRHLEATLQAIDDGVKDDARKQIAAKGFYSGNIPQEEANLQKIRDAAGQDDSQMARMMRAASGVTQALVDKIKASQTAEQACGSFDPATLQNLVDLNTLRENMGKLRVTQVDVLTFLQNYDDHCRAAMATGGFGDADIEQVIAGAHKGGHIDQAVAMWQFKIKLTDDHLARLDFLDKHWGSWQAQDGKLIFNSEETLTGYNGLTQNLANDIKSGRDLQAQVFQ